MSANASAMTRASRAFGHITASGMSSATAAIVPVTRSKLLEPNAGISAMMPHTAEIAHAQAGSRFWIA